jgi:hypothetical protein
MPFQGSFCRAVLASSLFACSASPDANRGDDSGPIGDSGYEAETSPPDDGGLGLPCTGARPSFAADVVPLFRGCAGFENCHGGQFADYAGLVNATTQRDTCSPARVLVTPGDVEHSYVLHKWTGIDICPMSNRMPPGGNFPRTSVQTIADWICTGAPNN